MFEGWARDILASYLGRFVDVQRDKLRIGLWSGEQGPPLGLVVGGRQGGGGGGGGGRQRMHACLPPPWAPGVLEWDAGLAALTPSPWHSLPFSLAAVVVTLDGAVRRPPCRAALSACRPRCRHGYGDAGQGVLENVRLRGEAFDYLKLPVCIESGVVGRLRIQVGRRAGWGARQSGAGQGFVAGFGARACKQTI